VTGRHPDPLPVGDIDPIEYMSYPYIQLHDEFAQIQQSAHENAMVLNLSKTKEIVFHRPHPSKLCLPLSLECIERVQTAKLLGVVFPGSFSFVTHVDGTLKLCSRRVFLLKQLRDQGCHFNNYM